MRNCKYEILQAFVAVLKAKMPTMIIRTKLNDFDTSDNSAYPYVYIGDVYQNEDGPKLFYRYPVECLVQVVYKDVVSLTELYETQGDVLSILNNPKPFDLTNDFEIMETELLSNNDSEIMTDSGILNIGLIRIRFTVLDNEYLEVD